MITFEHVYMGDKPKASLQLTSINLYALDNFDIVWDRNGLQIATYLRNVGVQENHEKGFREL